MATSAFTIYTLGDTSSFRAMLEGVALVFQDPLYSSNAAMGIGYGPFLGATILTLIMIYQAAFHQRMDIKILLAPLFAYLVLTGPKVTVQINDVYNIESPQQVSGIPVGLAFPLTIASGAAYLFTDNMERAYSTPNSPRILTDGFVMPLKTLNTIRTINMNESDPQVVQLVRDSYQNCVMGNSKFNMDEYMNAPDGFQYWYNFMTTQANGVVPYTDAMGAASVITCSNAGDKIYNRLNAFIQGDGSAGSQTLTYNFAKLVNLSMLGQDSSGGVNTNLNAEDFFKAFAKITERTTDEGRLFVTNALFNQTFISSSVCASTSAENEDDTMARCTAWVTTNEQQAEDNAAAATGFLKVMQDGQNKLIILAILMFPLVVLMIMFMGPKSMKIVVSYVIYLASTYLWLPMATIVNFIVFAKFKNTVYTFTGSETGDLFGIADYPAFYEAISNALSLANGLIATIPVFCMMFFSGMTMAALSLQNRWNQGRGRYANTTLDAPHVVGASPLINQRSAFQSNGFSGMVRADGGKAWETNFTQKGTAEVLQTMSLAEKKSILEAKRDAISHQLAQTHSSTATGSTNNEIRTNVNERNEKKLIDGIGYTITKGDSNTGTYGSNGVKDTYIAVDANNKIVSVLGTDSANLKFKIGVGVGDSVQNMSLTSADGSVGDPNSVMIPQNPGKITKGADADLNLRWFRVELGANYKNHDGVAFVDKDSHSTDDVKEKIALANSGSIDKSASRYIFKLVDDSTINELLNGRVHSYEQTTGVSQGNSTTENISRSQQLQKALTQTKSEIESIEKQLKDSLSVNFSSNLLAHDVLTRIVSMESVKGELALLNQQNMSKYSEAWEVAKADADNFLSRSEIAAHKIVNPEDYDYLLVYFASFHLNADAANDAHRIVTGIDTLKMYELSNPATKYDWKNWKDIEAETNKALQRVDEVFGSHQKFDFNNPDSIVILNPDNKTGYFDAPEFSQYSNIAHATAQNQHVHAGFLEIKGNQQQQNTARIYNAFLNAGFTTRQARILTAEVGRENSMRVEGMFGLHHDPRKKHIINGGIISFNQERKIALDRYMASQGLLKSGNPDKGTGSYVESQASLNAMAKFIMKELSSGKHKGWTAAWNALQNDNLTDAEIHKVVGKRYIVWAYDDPQYQKTGLQNIAAFRGVLDGMLKSQNLLSSSAPNATMVQAAAKVNKAGLNRQVLQKPSANLSGVIPEHLRYKEANQLTKDDLKKISLEAQKVLKKNAYDQIEKEFGIQVIKEKDGSVDYKLTNFQKLNKALDRSKSAKPLSDVVANAPAKLANKISTGIAGIRTPLAAEMDIVTGKTSSLYTVKTDNPHFPKVQPNGIGSGLTPPKETIYGQNISNEVDQAKIDRWIQSERDRNEVYQKDNSKMVNALLASPNLLRSDAGTSTTRPQPFYYKPVEEWSKPGTQVNTEALRLLVKQNSENNSNQRSAVEYNKWSGAQGD